MEVRAPRYRYPVPSFAAGVELQGFLEQRLRLPAGKVRDLVAFGAVYVSGRVELRPERRLETGAEVVVHVPRYGTRRFYESAPGRILYRDAWLLAYDKEPGIPCQATPYDAFNNVYAGLRRFVEAEAGGEAYLALHHRLDKDVSGVMLFTLHRSANGPVFRQFADGKAEKVYRAVACGRPPDVQWTEEAPIGRQGGRYRCVAPGQGKEAKTRFRVLGARGEFTFLEAVPVTGRTHQIRLHLARRGMPVLGDAQHGGRAHTRCMLHAFRLGLRHPVRDEPLLVEAPLPEAFRDAMGPGKVEDADPAAFLGTGEKITP